MNYAALITRQYGEGRVAIVTDMISGKNTYHGANPVSFWRQMLEWTGQRFEKENLNVALVDNAGLGALAALQELHQIRVTAFTLLDVATKNLSTYDVLYISGLPESVSDDVHAKIAPYVNEGGGLFIEAPNRSEENINILTSIDNVYCTSNQRPLQTNAYWTAAGLNHYMHYENAKLSFTSSFLVSSFGLDWSVLMSDVETITVTTNSISATFTTDSQGGSEFGMSFVSTMNKGLVVLTPSVAGSSSSSSIDSSSSLSSSSLFDDKYWSFCDNIVAYWKMNEDADSPVLWDDSGNFDHMATLYNGAIVQNTSNNHVDGKINGAISFNGFNEQASTFINQSLNFVAVGVDTPFSVSFWVKPTSADLDNRHMVFKDEVWEVYMENGSIAFILRDGSVIRYASTVLQPLATDKWNNVTVTYDGTLAGIKIYHNGVFYIVTALDTGAYTGMDDLDSSFFIASRNGQYYFEGEIDNVLIANKVLSAIEVESIFNAGKGTEECEGVYVYESSSSSSSSQSSESSSSSIDSSSSTSQSSLSSTSLSSNSSSSSSISSESSGGFSESSSSYGYTSSSSSYGFSTSSSTSESSVIEQSSSSSQGESSSSSLDSSSSGDEMLLVDCYTTNATIIWNDDTYTYTSAGTALDFDGTTLSLAGSGGPGGYLWSDGTYLYSGNSTTLSAYTFNGSSYVLKGSIATLASIKSVWGDGTYIYIGQGTSLDAYTFNGTTFTKVGTIALPNGMDQVTGDGTYIYVALGSFSGLHAYDFNGSTFTLKGSVIMASKPVSGVSTDGTYIYAALHASGIEAYTFNGSTFSLVGSVVNVATRVFATPTHVFSTTVSNRNPDVWAYTFDGVDFTTVGVSNSPGMSTDSWANSTYLYVADGSYLYTRQICVYLIPGATPTTTTTTPSAAKCAALIYCNDYSPAGACATYGYNPNVTNVPLSYSPSCSVYAEYVEVGANKFIYLSSSTSPSTDPNKITAVVSAIKSGIYNYNASILPNLYGVTGYIRFILLPVSGTIVIFSAVP